MAWGRAFGLFLSSQVNIASLLYSDFFYKKKDPFLKKKLFEMSSRTNGKDFKDSFYSLFHFSSLKVWDPNQWNLIWQTRKSFHFTSSNTKELPPSDFCSILNFGLFVILKCKIIESLYVYISSLLICINFKNIWY